MLALITRPREDALATADLLRQRGFDVLIEPMMQVVYIPDALPSLDGAQGILATSANGVRALAQATRRRDLAIWAVGDATARAAVELGFSPVESAGGDVQTLAQLVIDRVQPQAGELLHVAGTDVAGDLSGMLVKAGYGVRRVVLYHTQTMTGFSDDARTALAAGDVQVALFYSPRTAQIFVDLVQKTKIHTPLSATWALALSPAVAQKLAPLPWAGICVADHPTQDHLLAALDRARFQAD